MPEPPVDEVVARTFVEGRVVRVFTNLDDADSTARVVLLQLQDDEGAYHWAPMPGDKGMAGQFWFNSPALKGTPVVYRCDYPRCCLEVRNGELGGKVYEGELPE